VTTVKALRERSASEWDSLAVQMARNGFTVVPAGLDTESLERLRRLADETPLTQEADYPGSDKDVGYCSGDLIELLKSDPPTLPLLERLLGDPVFLVAWQRVGLPRSPGAPWHQDWEREFWPPAVNVAVYLDDVMPRTARRWLSQGRTCCRTRSSTTGLRSESRRSSALLEPSLSSIRLSGTAAPPTAPTSPAAPCSATTALPTPSASVVRSTLRKGGAGSSATPANRIRSGFWTRISDRIRRDQPALV
jgi:hypothetical protein